MKQLRASVVIQVEDDGVHCHRWCPLLMSTEETCRPDRLDCALGWNDRDGSEDGRGKGTLPTRGERCFALNEQEVKECEESSSELV